MGGHFLFGSSPLVLVAACIQAIQGDASSNAFAYGVVLVWLRIGIDNIRRKWRWDSNALFNGFRYLFCNIFGHFCFLHMASWVKLERFGLRKWRKGFF